MKKILLFGICSLIILVFNSCNENSNSHNNGNSQKIKIGFSMDSMKEERWLKDRDIFVARAKELGAEVDVQNSNNDTNEQFNQVKDMIASGINILVIIPHDLFKSQEIVQYAKRKQVKVICYDRLIKNANSDIYIGCDSTKVGSLMAQSLISTVPSGNYIIVNGPKTDYNSFMCNEGVKSVLTDYINAKKINIISEVWADDWKPEIAFNCVEKAIKDTKIDAVLASNDNLAQGAIQALTEAKLAGKVAVVGQDADLSGCQRVVEGTLQMTVYKPIDSLAALAAEHAVKMVKNEPLNIQNNIFDGKFFVPCVNLDPIAVTKENMNEIVINSGFHRSEDIYRNVTKK